MKTKSTSRSAFFLQRLVLGFALCSVGTLLVCAGLGKSAIETATTPSQPDGSVARFPAANTYTNTKLSYKVIDTPRQTYGYDIFVNGTLTIHQTNVPAVPGNEGFRTREDAVKVALLVIEKIRKGEMPPTISTDEMKTLKVMN